MIKKRKNNKNIKIFFDMEFTGLRKDTTPISIGCISSDDRTFYAEFTDYNLNQCDEWIQNNVLNNLKYNDTDNFVYRSLINLNKFKNHPSEDDISGFNIEMKSDSLTISKSLNEWLRQFIEEGYLIEFVADVCHYDFVLFIDLLLKSKGTNLTAINLDEDYSSCCYDLNIDIAYFLSTNARNAFNINRENLLKRLLSIVKNKYSKKEISNINEILNDTKQKHNSLYDAKICKEIYIALHKTNKFFS